MASNLPDDFDTLAHAPRFADDPVADALDESRVVYALERMAKLAGFDLPDNDSMSEAMDADGIDADDADHALYILSRDIRTFDQCVAVIRAAAVKNARVPA